MASDYHTLTSDDEFDPEASGSARDLDFMYDKTTINKAAVFLEDAIMVCKYIIIFIFHCYVNLQS